MKNWRRAVLTAAVTLAAALPGVGVASAAEPEPAVVETWCVHDTASNDTACFDSLDAMRNHRPDAWHLATVYDTYYAGGDRAHLYAPLPCDAGTGGLHAQFRTLGAMNNRTSSIRMWGACSRMTLFDRNDYGGGQSGWVPDTDRLSSFWNNKANSVWVT